MHKINIKTPPYSLVACDLSAAEVRTAANAAQDKEMINAYRAFQYEKDFTNSIELYSYERLNTINGYKSLHILTTEDILLDKYENQIKIIELKDEGDKNKLILGDNKPHTFIIDKPGQDLYSLIASKAYNNKYEDNLEFYPEGTKITFDGKEVICGKGEYTNKAGKVRRQDSKSLLIGLIYGRGVSSIAQQISESRLSKGQPPITKEDAQTLIDNIYKSFPDLKAWIDKTHDFIHKNGYIDDVFGRRRRLPDGMLPKYTIKYLNEDTQEGDFNPFLNCSNRINNDKINYYRDQLYNIKYYKEYDKIKENAYKDGIEIHDNTGYIAQAERQAVNFQAQAASSEINKLSMITIDKDPHLKELGVKLLLTIHDEVIVECPSENAEEVAEILPKILITVAGDKMKCPLKADSSIERHWYEGDNLTVLNDHFTSFTKDKGMTPKEAVEELCKEYPELLKSQLENLFLNHCGYLWDNMTI